MIYGKLHDGSAQVDYAERSYDAFKKTLDDDWINYSIFTLALAYNNNEKYGESLSFIKELFEDNAFLNDSIMLSELYSLKALSLFALDRYAESLNAYSQARILNKNSLSDGDVKNIQVALEELKVLEDTCCSYTFLEKLYVNEYSQDAFAVYARDGRYKEAYESLEIYRNLQDSVLSFISRNNVSESVNQYKELRGAVLKGQIQKEKLYIWLILLFIVVIGVIIVWRIREKLHMEEMARLKAEADMESIRTDLLSQLESAKAALEKVSSESGRQKTLNFQNIIKQRYAEANRICDDFYQLPDSFKNNNSEKYSEIISIVRCFTEKEELKNIAAYVDEQSGGLYSSFKTGFFGLSEESHQLFLYLMLGFNARTISVIIGQNINVVYNKKSRLKAKIQKSSLPDVDKYLRLF